MVTHRIALSQCGNDTHARMVVLGLRQVKSNIIMLCEQCWLVGWLVDFRVRTIAVQTIGHIFKLSFTALGLP